MGPLGSCFLPPPHVIPATRRRARSIIRSCSSTQRWRASQRKKARLRRRSSMRVRDCAIILLSFLPLHVSAAPPTVDAAKAFLDKAEVQLQALTIAATRADWVRSTYITDD